MCRKIRQFRLICLFLLSQLNNEPASSTRSEVDQISICCTCSASILQALVKQKLWLYWIVPFGGMGSQYSLACSFEEFYKLGFDEFQALLQTNKQGFHKILIVSLKKAIAVWMSGQTRLHTNKPLVTWVWKFSFILIFSLPQFSFSLNGWSAARLFTSF